MNATTTAVWEQGADVEIGSYRMGSSVAEVDGPFAILHGANGSYFLAHGNPEEFCFPCEGDAEECDTLEAARAQLAAEKARAELAEIDVKIAECVARRRDIRTQAAHRQNEQALHDLHVQRWDLQQALKRGEAAMAGRITDRLERVIAEERAAAKPCPDLLAFLTGLRDKPAAEVRQALDGLDGDHD